MTNTEISYQYRDASNYKTGAVEVLPGTLTPEQKARVFAALKVDHTFLPDQVELPTLQSNWSTHYEDDHIWHELESVEDTEARPTMPYLPAAEWAESFDGIVWDVDAATKALREWQQDTPSGH